MESSEEIWAKGLIGRMVNDRYRLDRVLGTGGMGAVFAATQVNVGRSVAVKVLTPAVANSPSVVERFEQEARAAASVGGRGVVAVYDRDRDPQLGPYLVMEHLRGESLSEAIERRGRFPAAEAAALALDLLGTLAAVHARGIIHRDLKPGNIFFAQEPDGTTVLKVLDFGIARMAVEGRAQGLTQQGMVLGTPQYMSPEQAISSADVDARADLYAVGAILYRIISGQPPYRGSDISQIFAALLSGPPAPLRGLVAGLPDGFYAFIDRALASDRNNRFPDAASMAEALRALMPMLQGVGLATVLTDPGFGVGAYPAGVYPPGMNPPTPTPYGGGYAPNSNPGFAGGPSAAGYPSAPGIPGTVQQGGYPPGAIPGTYPGTAVPYPPVAPAAPSSTVARPVVIAVGGALALVVCAALVAWWATSKTAHRAPGAPTTVTAGGGSVEAPRPNAPRSDPAVDATLRQSLAEGRAAVTASDLPRARQSFNRTITQALTAAVPAGSIAARLSGEAAMALGDLEYAQMAPVPQYRTTSDLSVAINQAFDPYRAAISAYPRGASSGHADLTQCLWARMGRTYERQREIMMAFPPPLEDPYGAGATVASQQRGSSGTYLEGARRYYEMALAPTMPTGTVCRTEALAGLQRSTPTP